MFNKTKAFELKYNLLFSSLNLFVTQSCRYSRSGIAISRGATERGPDTFESGSQGVAREGSRSVRERNRISREGIGADFANCVPSPRS